MGKADLLYQLACSSLHNTNQTKDVPSQYNDLTFKSNFRTHQ